MKVRGVKRTTRTTRTEVELDNAEVLELLISALDLPEGASLTIRAQERYSLGDDIAFDSPRCVSITASWETRDESEEQVG
jgi:hypothetical protein